jgi:hypothetical protein
MAGPRGAARPALVMSSARAADRCAAAPVADAYSLLGAASGSRPSTTPYSRTSTEAPVIDSASLTLQSRATAAIFGRLGGEPETSVIGTDEASVDDGLLELIASVDDLL